MKDSNAMNQPERIKDLVTRFFERRLSTDEIAELENWLLEDVANRNYFDKVNDGYQARHVLQQFTPERIDNAWSRFSERITEKIVSIRPKRVFARTAWRVAASVAILLAFTFLLWKVVTDSYEGTEKLIVNNAINRNTFVLLPDSSLVWLNVNSTIEYESSFGKEHRNITLHGEAYFDVRKKQKHDFIVNADEMSVHVKGTRFNVRAFKGEELKTTLEEGNVELVLTGRKKSYSMTPGDQIVVSKKRDTVTLRKVNPTNFTAWKEEQLVFDNVPLADIILKLENRYKVKITVDKELGKRERFTMTVHQETIEEVLEMIHLASNLKWKKHNHTILIYE